MFADTATNNVNDNDNNNLKAWTVNISIYIIG